jgi:hypothetical protein
MIKEYFNKVQSKNIGTLLPKNKAKVGGGVDKLFSNEIDLKTFKIGIDVLLPNKWKGEDIGYI